MIGFFETNYFLAEKRIFFAILDFILDKDEDARFLQPWNRFASLLMDAIQIW